MLRSSLDVLPASRIREVANAAMGRADVLKFWFGEGDLVTPEFIRAAAKRSLDDGHTFYNQNLGLPELRSALAEYSSALHGTAIDEDRVCVTSAGVNGLALVSQALLEPGDRVVITTPVWPNLTSQPQIMGARVARVALDCWDGEWRLDLDQLLAAATPATKLVLVNSPNNPTGWVLPQADWEALRAHCLRHGIWLVADDAYERIVFDPRVTLGQGTTLRATGVLAQVDVDERFISANTFSKTWTMTGWRLGWLLAPRGFIANFAKMVEFNTSCAPSFVQHAGFVAIRDGAALIGETRARLHRARDRLVARLRQVPGIAVAPPAGSMYCFFRIEGVTDDSLSFCKRLVTEAGLGLAPGVAFGPEGEGYVRWCFAATEPLLDEGVHRLANFLARN